MLAKNFKGVALTQNQVSYLILFCEIHWSAY
ncbi:Uncharacterised protein [Legionella pneumophila]|nr:hypothetical protein [Legionella pneumophila]CZG39576.1 Uncharacterised protein [Legionella pneumophila]CZG47992.1 Uncharacterised protein [Legionella pneumophila]CZG48055.1 Uncharacterised protein [Legionella pneumophila]CZG48512.1 Uncharacterised protein [Legionella pneumophila]